jgi:hypothetical protein
MRSERQSAARTVEERIGTSNLRLAARSLDRPRGPRSDAATLTKLRKGSPGGQARPRHPHTTPTRLDDLVKRTESAIIIKGSNLRPSPA